VIRWEPRWEPARAQFDGDHLVHDGAMPPRLLPILLPSLWTTAATQGQLWNVSPAHGPQWTVLDVVPLLRI